MVLGLASVAYATLTPEQLQAPRRRSSPARQPATPTKPDPEPDHESPERQDRPKHRRARSALIKDEDRRGSELARREVRSRTQEATRPRGP